MISLLGSGFTSTHKYWENFKILTLPVFNLINVSNENGLKKTLQHTPDLEWIGTAIIGIAIHTLELECKYLNQLHSWKRIS